jgi:hypothetical protein
MIIREVMVELLECMKIALLIHILSACAGLVATGIQDPPNDAGPVEPCSPPHSGSRRELPRVCLMLSKDVPFEELLQPWLIYCYLESCRRLFGKN